MPCTILKQLCNNACARRSNDRGAGILINFECQFRTSVANKTEIFSGAIRISSIHTSRRIVTL